MVVILPGVIAYVTAVLRDLGVLLESMLQRGRSPGEAVPGGPGDPRDAGERDARGTGGDCGPNAVLEAPTMIRIEPVVAVAAEIASLKLYDAAAQSLSPPPRPGWWPPAWRTAPRGGTSRCARRCRARAPPPCCSCPDQPGSAFSASRGVSGGRLRHRPRESRQAERLAPQPGGRQPTARSAGSSCAAVTSRGSTPAGCSPRTASLAYDHRCLRFGRRSGVARKVAEHHIGRFGHNQVARALSRQRAPRAPYRRCAAELAVWRDLPARSFPAYTRPKKKNKNNNNKNKNKIKKKIPM